MLVNYSTELNQFSLHRSFFSFFFLKMLHTNHEHREDQKAIAYFVDSTLKVKQRQIDYIIIISFFRLSLTI